MRAYDAAELQIMNLTLYVWRQNDAHSPGGMVRYEAEGIDPDMSFLEMLDVVNWNLAEKGEEPIAFDSDERAAGRPLPTAGTAFLSVRDGDKPSIAPIAAALAPGAR
jgi:hypothetical protein